MIDLYGRDITYLRLSVTELCNLRCRYCMGEDGICKKDMKDMLSEEEMIQVVKAAVSIGIKKVRITGGEPLVKSNIISICKNIASIEGVEEVCITTNGTLLNQLARPLKEAGVKRLNISLDTLNEEKYHHLTRIGKLNDAWKGLLTALEVGFEKIKINTVLMGGFNHDEILSLANLTKQYPVDVRFIELMPMYDGGDFGPEAFISYQDVLQQLPQLEAVENDGGVAKLYRFPNALGNVGLISPLNAHFCGSCNRLRVTADGKVKPCLHSNIEFNIKGLSLEEMIEQMKQAVYAKPAHHKELSYHQRSDAGRTMNQIGG